MAVPMQIRTSPGRLPAVITPELRLNLYMSQRRSQRIVLAVPVVISGISSDGSVFSERTTTLVVNAHGALIQLREPVVAGEKLRIRNAITDEEICCVVTNLNPGKTVVPEVGVQFCAPNPHFWHVSFPPANWSPHSPEARRQSPTPVLSAAPVPKK
jgi:hypothetical protein